MALYPKATKKLIPPGPNDPKLRDVVGAILHVDAGNVRDLYDFFATRSGGIESHFQIAKDGTVFQYRDTQYEADANYKANSFEKGGRLVGFVSIETQGLEKGEWTVSQLKAIKELLVWLSEEHGFPLEEAPDTNGPGVGYHTLFGAPSAWTPVAKSCPGPDRKKQFHNVLVPWMEGLKEAPAVEVPEEDEKPSTGVSGVSKAPSKPKQPDPKGPYFKLDPAVKPGKRHPQVRLLQRLLIKAGYGPIRGAVTNYYGENTEAAVRRFHKANSRFSEGPGDGAIGPKGWEHLQKEADDA